ncbi:MAG: dethiobiotin synthase [Limnohabitans sp.]|jgi:dethiobiotin synthetase|nr:dethiobiotin synthase [Limnohabitans sp.]
MNNFHLQTPFSCFVTGTDTEIGKTLVASALVYRQAQQGFRVAAMKPVAAGAYLHEGRWCNEDVDALAQVASVDLPVSDTSPYIFQTPAAPHLAAAAQQVHIDPALILRSFEHVRTQAQAVVVEGVGGFCVPLNDHYDTADLARDLGLPVVLVVGMRLGCISQALLTAEAIRARGLDLLGWVANVVDPQMLYLEENIQAIAQRIHAPLLGSIPRLVQPDAAAAATHLTAFPSS